MSQLLDLAFFYLLYTYYSRLDKQVGDYYKKRDLVNQVDQYSCLWSQCNNKVVNLRLMIPEYFFGLINSFKIASILQISKLNGSGNKR